MRASPEVAFRRTHNGQGLRSLREIPYARRPGLMRILLLGDSFFWGFGVNDEEVVSEVMQREAGPRYEIINGGVVGYGTDQELLWLLEEGVKYRPDVVVLGAFPTNDVDEIGQSLPYHVPKPFFTFSEGALVLRNVPVPDTRETRRKAFDEPGTWGGKLRKYLRHHTHLYPLLTARLNSIPRLRPLLLALGLADEYTTRLPGVGDFQVRSDLLQELEDQLILEIARRSREMGAHFLLVHIPRREWDPPSGLTGLSGVSFQEWNDRWSSRLRSFSAWNGIDFLDLLPVVREHESRGDLLYTRVETDHHWNRRGHQVAAEAILGALPRPADQ